MQLFSTVLFICLFSLLVSQVFTTSSPLTAPSVSLSNRDLFLQASHLIQQTAVVCVIRSFRASYQLAEHLWRETSWCDSLCCSGSVTGKINLLFVLSLWGKEQQHGRWEEWEWEMEEGKKNIEIPLFLWLLTSFDLFFSPNVFLFARYKGRLSFLHLNR